MLPAMFDVMEKQVERAASTMVNGQDIFTITGGPIEILALGALCITANDGTGSTLQWQADGTVGASATITGASGTLASAAAGTIVAAVPGTLSTAPSIYTAGIGINGTVGIIVPAGIIEIVIGIGSTTGTWKHFMRYRPLVASVQVVAA